jgi:hypothetical protein
MKEQIEEMLAIKRYAKDTKSFDNRLLHELLKIY